MNYSIRYLNESGITERSEFLAMESDATAVHRARLDLPRYFMVELWKDDNLLSRVFRDAVTN